MLCTFIFLQSWMNCWFEITPLWRVSMLWNNCMNFCKNFSCSLSWKSRIVSMKIWNWYFGWVLWLLVYFDSFLFPSFDYFSESDWFWLFYELIEFLLKPTLLLPVNSLLLFLLSALKLVARTGWGVLLSVIYCFSIKNKFSIFLSFSKIIN